jgi:dihydrofolate reductase
MSTISAAPRPRDPVVIYAASSLDGYLATPDGGVGWLDAFSGSPPEKESPSTDDHGYEEFVAGIGSLVIGRTTFEQVQGFGEWPYGKRPTAVLTSRRDTSDEGLPVGVRWDVGHDLVGLVEQLQGEAAGGTWVLGGGLTHRAFLRAGLVSEIWQHVMPVLLGDGIPMFPAAFAPVHVELIEARPHADGVVMLRYRLEQGAR